MAFDFFQEVWENAPVGIIATDNRFVASHINPHAQHIFQELGLKISAGDDFMSLLDFYTINRESFDFKACINTATADKAQMLNKSLLLKGNNGQEKFVLLGASFQKHNHRSYYLFTINDFSSETDCMAFLKAPDASDLGINHIIGQHKHILEMKRLITLAADTSVTVLITGESGTGKELVADAIHQKSERRHKAFIKVNCSALSETLLESELFGHVKGSFTGAYKDKPGKFEQAHEGTIFLDEIGDVSPALQVKLLRVLQSKVIERVGDNTPIKVDMRIIAATNKNLRELITKGAFREDFFYRLNVFPIQTPALRDRKNDIPLLCNYYIKKFNKSFGKNIKGISPNAYRLLMDYCWPGNVRELENVLEHAFVLVQDSMIDIFDLPQELRVLAYQDGFCKPDKENQDDGKTRQVSFKKTRSGRLDISKEDLLTLLDNHGWNQTKTAAKLGISRVALWKKIKKFDLH